MDLGIDIDGVKGFMDAVEGARLYDIALEAAALGPCLEIGSYCGKSTVYLGRACQRLGMTLFSVDHHRGSEEHQPGEEYHDEDLYDPGLGKMDSFRVFRDVLERAQLEDTVVPVVARSALVARHWATPLALVFIDGGHSEASAIDDYEGWSKQIMPGGLLAIHDIFDDPADGGQAPHLIYRRAIETGGFVPLPRTKTLGVLRRTRSG